MKTAKQNYQIIKELESKAIESQPIDNEEAAVLANLNDTDNF